MPLPLIPILFGGLAAAAGATGIKKGFDAKSDYELAQYNNEKATKAVKNANASIDSSRNQTTKALENYGQTKIDVLSGSIKNFYNSIEKITDLGDVLDSGYEDLRYFNPTTPAFSNLKSVSIEATSMLAGGVSGLGTGALLAVGTYNVVMGGLGGLLVTATTGTALGSLTGIAATNATLAWLGGGALAAGGLGMAGGMAVLGGIVAGPALLIGGGVMAKKADEAYWSSRENLEKADTYAKEAETIVKSLQLISTASNQMNGVLKNLDALQRKYNARMEYVIERRGTSFRRFDAEEKDVFYRAMRIASTIKDVLECSILKEDGSYNASIQNICASTANKISSWGEGTIVTQTRSDVQSTKNVEKSTALSELKKMQPGSPEYNQLMTSAVFGNYEAQCQLAKYFYLHGEQQKADIWQETANETYRKKGNPVGSTVIGKKDNLDYGNF